MSITYAILGFLSWQPATGYDLKKMFANSATHYWSGNNNQIYRALVKLHEDGLVTREVQTQESGPARKVYTVTEAGLEALKRWVQVAPDPPQLKNTFLIQLAWSDQLSDTELNDLIKQYEEEVHINLLMMQEQKHRNLIAPRRTKRETLIWQRIADNWITFYTHELEWVQQLQQALNNKEEK